MNKNLAMKTAIIFVVSTIIFAILISITPNLSYTFAPTKSFSIIIDAGHGGIDEGSYGDVTNVPESKINLSIAKILQKKCEDAKANVIMTRKDENGLYDELSRGFKLRDMNKRKKIAQESNADVLISVHCNHSPHKSAHGVVIYYNDKNPRSQQLAQCLETEFNKMEEVSRVRIDDEKMFMTNLGTLPAVIVECGFLSNPTEEELLQTKDYQNKIASTILKGVVNSLK